jgi:LPS sulfotransferase NodH
MRLGNQGFGQMYEWMYEKHHYDNKFTLSSLQSLIVQAQSHKGRVFNSKIMWTHLFRNLLPLLPYEAWPEWFGNNIHIITMDREDKMNQAVSFQKAANDKRWQGLKPKEDFTNDVIIDKYGDTTVNQIINCSIWALQRPRAKGLQWLKDNNISIIKNVRYSNLYSDTEELLLLLEKEGIPYQNRLRRNLSSIQSNNVNTLMKELMVEELKISEKEFDGLSLDQLDEIQRDLVEMEKRQKPKTLKEFMS